MGWIIGIVILGFLAYVYSSGKKSERGLNQKWVVCFKDTETGEEISKIISSMEIYRGLQQLRAAGAGDIYRMAAMFHPALQAKMMSKEERAMFSNELFSRLHPPAEFEPLKGNRPPKVVKEFFYMIAEAPGMEVDSLEPLNI